MSETREACYDCEDIATLSQLFVKRNINDDFFNKFNYEIYGGSPILGVNSPVVIGHGISSAKAIKNMLLLSKSIHEARLTGKIKRAMTKYTHRT